MARILGIDMGIASVGWGLIDTDEEKIIGRGVRVFPAAEDPKEKTSLAIPRRLARGTRVRLRRRAERMVELKQFFVDSGLLTEDELAELYELKSGALTPYALRAQGLDRKLEGDEWARVLTQLCKRRGYKSMRLGGGDASEDGKVISALKENRALMEKQGYRTAGEMLAKDEKFQQNKRNKGSYDNVIRREMLEEEIRTLFEKQEEFGNPHASEKNLKTYLEILNRQEKILEGEDILKMVGKCSLETDEYRAPMASITFELFRFLQKLNNVRWVIDSETFDLDLDQKNRILEKALSQKSEITYAAIRRMINLEQRARFTSVRPQRPKGLLELSEAERIKALAKAEKDAEGKEKLPGFKFYSAVKDTLLSAELEDVWKKDFELDGLLNDDGEIIDLESNAKVVLLDSIGNVFTYFKYDDTIRAGLKALNLSDEIIEALSASGDLNASKNGNLSIKAMRKMIPFMLWGKGYSDAAQDAGYHHSVKTVGQKQALLPVINPEEIRNPVVLRSMTQTRKVINAIIRTFGPLDEIHIELARSLNQPADVRSKIEREQKERKAQADSRLKEIKEVLDISNPRPHDLVKYRFFKEQNGQCAYSGKSFEVDRIFEAGYAEVDHILPYSRSFNNSLDNRVLVFTSENQKKKNKTPYEYKQDDPIEWKRFTEWVSASALSMRKKSNLTMTNFDEREEEFRSRNLNDTRYATREMKSFIEDNLSFGEDKKLKVVALAGGVTAFLRQNWVLEKNRDEDGHRHHALDALVIAATTQSIVQRVAEYRTQDKIRKLETWLPEPWEGFADQVRVWMAEDPAVYDEGIQFNPESLSDEERESIRPLFVSQSPKRKATGQAHKETLYRIEGTEGGEQLLEDGSIAETPVGRTLLSKKVALENLNLSTLENILEKDGTNRELYLALKARLEAFKDKPAQAFKEPFYKPSAPGKNAPLVRSVRVMDGPSSGGVELRGGMYANGSMIRVDIFESIPKTEKERRKFYAVPIYVADTAKAELPNRAIVAHKTEDEWLEMDENYAFKFSLYPGDYCELWKNGKLEAAGTYVSTDRSAGALAFSPHDKSSSTQTKKGIQSMSEIKKFEVDVLGLTKHEVKKEKRRGFSDRRDKKSGTA